MKSAGPAIAAVVTVLATLLIIYVASVGPAIWLHNRGMLSEEVGGPIYVPLFWAANSTQVIGAPLERYAELWVPEIAAPQPAPATVVVPAPTPSPTPAPSGS